MKQETLEEVAERLLDKYSEKFDISNSSKLPFHFNNRNELEELIYEVIKWQQERSYSEEEVKQMLIDCCGEVSCEDGVLIGKTPVELYNWIDEKFKNK